MNPLLEIPFIALSRYVFRYIYRFHNIKDNRFPRKNKYWQWIKTCNPTCGACRRCISFLRSRDPLINKNNMWCWLAQVPVRYCIYIKDCHHHNRVEFKLKFYFTNYFWMKKFLIIWWLNIYNFINDIINIFSFYMYNDPSFTS